MLINICVLFQAIYIINYTNTAQINNILYSVLHYMNFLSINTLFLFILLSIFLINFFTALFKYTIPLLSGLGWLYIHKDLSWPNTLYYGFNIIHPPLFYITFIGAGFLFLTLAYLHKVGIKFWVVTGTTSIILGMFWGSINESWGFFWTNDQIEIALASLLIICFLYLHTVKLLTKLWLYLYAYIILIFYITLLRFNILFTIHSFFEGVKINYLLIFLMLSSLTIVFRLNSFSYLITAPLSVYFFIYKSIFILYNLYLNLKVKLLTHFILSLAVSLVFSKIYYYTIVGLNFNSVQSFVNIFSNNLNTHFFNTSVNSLIISTLNFSNTSTNTYFSFLVYSYTYYLGFFYFFTTLILISFVKIYIK